MVESIERIIDEVLNKLEVMWSKWQPMPSPEDCRNIIGPQNSGVYQIRNNQTDKLILFGIGKECRKRMKSLFPPPNGTGKRNNLKKRNHVLEHWRNLDCRTMETNCKEEAEAVEGLLKAKKSHLFNT